MEAEDDTKKATEETSRAKKLTEESQTEKTQFSKEPAAQEAPEAAVQETDSRKPQASQEPEQPQEELQNSEPATQEKEAENPSIVNKEELRSIENVEDVYKEKPKTKRYFKIGGIAATVTAAAIGSAFWLISPDSNEEEHTTLKKHGHANVAEILEKEQELAVNAKKREKNPDFLKSFPKKTPRLVAHSVSHEEAFSQFVTQPQEPLATENTHNIAPAPVAEQSQPETIAIIEEAPTQEPEPVAEEIALFEISQDPQPNQPEVESIGSTPELIAESTLNTKALQTPEDVAEETTEKIAASEPEIATEKLSTIGEEKILKSSLEDEPVLTQTEETVAKPAEVTREITTTEEFASEVESYLEDRKVISVLNRGAKSRMTLDNTIYTLGDTINSQKGIVWSNINEKRGRVEFVDKMGNVYSKRY